MRPIGLTRRGLTSLLAMALASCGFTAGSDVNQCTDTIPSACGEVAHCVLDGNQFLQGDFPGAQTFIVRTSGPQNVTFTFVFDDRVAAGTGLSLSSTEPDCSQESSYTSAGDLFELAGPSGQLSFTLSMVEGGDHLVQFHSDAYCSYQLRYQ